MCDLESKALKLLKGSIYNLGDGHAREGSLDVSDLLGGKSGGDGNGGGGLLNGDVLTRGSSGLIGLLLKSLGDLGEGALLRGAGKHQLGIGGYNILLGLSDGKLVGGSGNIDGDAKVLDSLEHGGVLELSEDGEIHIFNRGYN